jgi:hypothetical protein
MLPQIIDCGLVVSAPRVEVLYYKVTSVRLLQTSRYEKPDYLDLRWVFCRCLVYEPTV